MDDLTAELLAEMSVGGASPMEAAVEAATEASATATAGAAEAEAEAEPPRARIATEADLQPTPGRFGGPLPDIGDLTQRDMLSFITATTTQNGLVGHNIDSFNELMEHGISRIMTQLFFIDRSHANERAATEADRAIKSFQVQYWFHDVEVGKPTCTTYLTGQIAPLFPNRARLTGIPYSGAVTLGATVVVKAFYADGHTDEKRAEIPPFQIGCFPIMFGTRRCHTSNCTREALKAMEEDPSDSGGYFLAKSIEWSVDLLENICYNRAHVHRAMKAAEHVRAEFLSQPGGAFENSSQIRIRLMTSGQLTFEITSTKFERVRLPFYLVYRLFGMTDDEEIVSTVVFDPAARDPITVRMLDILERAFGTVDPVFAPLAKELDRARLVQLTAERISKYLTNPKAYLNDDHAVRYLNADLLRSFDRVLLPHMGQTADSRIRKLRYLGLVIHKMLLVHLGVLMPTDRDSYREKRVHGAGVSLAKAFKTQVNNSVVSPIYKSLRRELKNSAWSAITDKTLIDTFRNALTTSDLNRAMEQAITSGNKTIVVRRRAAMNRVSSQPLERKNELNKQSALRTVVTQNSGNASKQTERADMMRRVHPTYTGFICVAQSADTGEMVGMRKQLAITAGVCTAGEVLPLKLRLLADPAVVPLDLVPSADILRLGLSTIFLNGEWVGCCRDAPALVARYRLLRREGRAVDPHSTITWDPVTGDVEFWLDVGRLWRPLLIVDSNVEEYDRATRARAQWRKAGASSSPEPPAVEFAQGIRFTREHARAIVAGTLTLADLVREGIAEYITPEEQENCLIAESIVTLQQARHDVTRQYTHCDVEQAIFGLAAHVSPYGNHTQPARVTYETNQSRQTGGWFALNFPYRLEKNRFFQFYNETPLVATLVHHLVPSNGMNVVIAYTSYGGDNQEDSAIINQASADRGMFAGAFFRYERAELEKGESFCNPDALTTKNLKPNASYEKLVNGFIRPGSIVRYGDVLIGRVAKITRRPDDGDDGRYQYTDRSIVYRLHEPAFVEDVLRPRNENDALFGIVKLRYERPLRTGDKLSSRSGNKSIAAVLLSQSDMPFMDNGVTPDIIINTHSFPSRMTIGQLIETTVAKNCARKGVIDDATAFLPTDHVATFSEAEALGYRYNGRERLYNGMDGTYMNAAVFVGFTYEQRLQKFVLDDEQSVGGSCPTDATTGQPLGGKRIQGALRLGEMEVWGLESHGSMLNLHEKITTDSDARPLHVCRGCGSPALYNEYHSIYACRQCKELADISVVDSAKSATLMREELAASNIQMRLGLRPREFDAAHACV